MKMRIGLPLVLMLMCLTFAGVPAMAQSIPLWDTGGPEFPSPVGVGLNNGVADSVSWDCVYHDCDVTGATIYAFDTVTGGPFHMDQVSFLLSTVPFDFKGGQGGTTTSIFQLGDCLTGENGVQFCQESINFGRSIDVPHGLNYLALYGGVFTTSPLGHVVAWSNGNGTGDPSTTLLLPMGGTVEGYPSPLSFAVFGTPTVPEPSSMIMLGSGVLGLAGVLRRKLFR